MPLKLNKRSYQGEDDYWRIRSFLRETFMLYERREINWHVSRLDYWRGHMMKNCNKKDALNSWVFLWETLQNQIMAVLIAEEPSQAYIQVHPAFRSGELEKEMILLAEEHLSINRDGKQMLSVWADSENLSRLEKLKQLGYSKGKWVESQWRCDLDSPIPEVPLPTGYSIRSLGDKDELPARSWASWRGFHPDKPEEEYEGWEWYQNIQTCPLYRRDLDLVVVSSSGEIASFCTFWFDDVTRTVYIEPVATVPGHLRRGLARAAITEGLRRSQKLGATRAFVGGFEPWPNALYSSTLSQEHDLLEQWTKKW
jgi:mycothiol synthase